MGYAAGAGLVRAEAGQGEPGRETGPPKLSLSVLS